MRPIKPPVWTCLVCFIPVLLALSPDVFAQGISQTTANQPRARIVAFLLMPYAQRTDWDTGRGGQIYRDSSNLPYERVPGDVLRPETPTRPAPQTRDYPVFEPPQVGPRGQTTVVVKSRPMALLTLRNDSDQPIKSVEWEFTYPRLKGGKEVIYRQVKSNFPIQPHETISLMKVFSNDPCQLTSAVVNGVPHVATVCKGAITGSHPLQVRITRVKYKDGVEEQSDWKVATQGVGRSSKFEPFSGPIRILGAP